MQSLLDSVVKLGPRLVPALVVFAVVLAAGLLVAALTLGSLRRWAQRTRTSLDDIFVAALQWPVRLWVLILALELAVRTVDLPPRAAVPVEHGLLILWIVSLTLAASRLATSLLSHYGRELKGNAPITSLAQNLVRLMVVSIGLLLILNVLGVSITPILTALGVGGLAVALGLQETLSNLFAGLFVSVAGNVRVGDYIKLNTGEEGHVTDVSWRATTLRTLANNLVIIPNAKLAQAMVTNYSLPEPRMSLVVPVNVGYGSDADRVEQILQEEASRAVGEVPGLLPEPAPSVMLIPGFGEYALGFTVAVNVESFVAQYRVQHELRKRFLKRLADEGIELAIPMRVLAGGVQGGTRPATS